MINFRVFTETAGYGNPHQVQDWELAKPNIIVACRDTCDIIVHRESVRWWPEIWCLFSTSSYIAIGRLTSIESATDLWNIWDRRACKLTYTKRQHVCVFLYASPSINPAVWSEYIRVAPHSFVMMKVIQVSEHEGALWYRVSPDLHRL